MLRIPNRYRQIGDNILAREIACLVPVVSMNISVVRPATYDLGEICNEWLILNSLSTFSMAIARVTMLYSR